MNNFKFEFQKSVSVLTKNFPKKFERNERCDNTKQTIELIGYGNETKNTSLF